VHFLFDPFFDIERGARLIKADLEQIKQTVNNSGNILLIGIGNEYRQDDGAGPFICNHERIRGLKGVSGLKLKGLRIMENSGDGIAMIKAWEGAGMAILVDAVYSGQPAGTIFRLDLMADPLPDYISPSSTHGFGIPDCIALSRSLGFLPGKMIFYGIEGEKFGQGLGLSAAVRLAAETVVEKIAAEITVETAAG
jgi:hydrogenase maturation protease